MAVLNGLPVHTFCTENQLDSIEKLRGQIIVCTDSEQMYVDAANNKRIGIGSPVRVATVDDLPLAPLDKFYVTVDTGNVYLYVDNTWKQIGSDDVDLSNYVGTVSLQSNTVNGTTASFGIDTDDNVPNVYAGASDGTNTSLVQVTKGSTLVTATDGTNTTNITVTPSGVTYNNHAENTIGGLAVIGSDGKVPSHATISSGTWSSNNTSASKNIRITSPNDAAGYYEQQVIADVPSSIVDGTTLRVWKCTNSTDTWYLVESYDSELDQGNYGLVRQADIDAGEAWNVTYNTTPMTWAETTDGFGPGHYSDIDALGWAVQSEWDVQSSETPTTDFYYSTTDGLLVKTATGYSPVSSNVDLSGYATVNALTTGLAGKANSSDVYTIAQIDNMLSPLNSSAHTHSNKTVLDALSVSNNALTYNGTVLSTLTLQDVRAEVAAANHLSIEVVDALPNGYVIDYQNQSGPLSGFDATFVSDRQYVYYADLGLTKDDIYDMPAVEGWVSRQTIADGVIEQYAIVNGYFDDYNNTADWYITKVWFVNGVMQTYYGDETGGMSNSFAQAVSSELHDPANVEWEHYGTVWGKLVKKTGGEPTKLYLVPATNGETNNVYDEYVYTNGSFEKIGSTATDISGYVTTSALNTALAGKADSSHTHTTTDITNFTTSVNSLVDSKLTSYYTKSQIDSMDFGSTVYMGGGFEGDGSEDYPYSVNLYNYFQPDMLFGNQSGGQVYLWNNGARILFESVIVFNADRWSGVEVGYYDAASTPGRTLTLRASSLTDFKLKIGSNTGTANQAYGLAVIGSDGKLPASILPATESGVVPYLMFIAPQPEDDAEVIHLEVKYKTTIDGTEATLINTYDGTNRAIVYGSSNGSTWTQCPTTGFGGPQFGGCSIIANVSNLLSTSSITYLSYRWLDSTGVPYTEYMGMVYPNACGMSVTSTTSGSSTPSVDLTGYVTTTAMNTALAGKANTSHTHNISDVTGLTTDLNGKTITTSISSSSTASQLPTAKAVWDAIAAIDIPESFDPSGYLTTETANSTYAKLYHEHTASEITDFDLVVDGIVSTALGNLDYAARSHSHSISDITNLSTTLSGKVDTSTLNNYYTRTQVDNLISSAGGGSVDLTNYSGAVLLACEGSTMLAINYYNGTTLGTYDISGSLSNTTISAGYHIGGDPITGDNTPGFSGYISLGLQTDNGSPNAPNTAGGFAIVGENGKLPASIIPEDTSSASSSIRTPVLMLKKPTGDESEGYHLEVEISTNGGTTYTSIINTRTNSAHRALVKASSNGRTWNDCPTTGFGPQYSNCPVMVDVNGLVDPTLLTMISYRWANADGTSYSDWFGTVYPNAGEVPA